MSVQLHVHCNYIKYIIFHLENIISQSGAYNTHTAQHLYKSSNVNSLEYKCLEIKEMAGDLQSYCYCQQIPGID